MILQYASDSVDLSDDRLAAELTQLGIPFVSSSVKEDSGFLPKHLLLQGLASSSDARLRMALIPLLLARPDYAQSLIDKIVPLSEQGRVTLICYYTAAMLLQQKYKERLFALGMAKSKLPDVFSYELRLPAVNHIDTLLMALAERHVELSGRSLNWRGTYEQAALRFIKRLEWEHRWTKS